MKNAGGGPQNSVSEKSLAALVKVHSRKRTLTARNIQDAITRMANGSPMHLKPGYKWTRRAVATEAEIHVNTLVAKMGSGDYVYQTALNQIDSFRARRTGKPANPEQVKLARLRDELTEVIRERDMLIDQLKGFEARVIAERDKAVAAIKNSEYALKKLHEAGLLQSP